MRDDMGNRIVSFRERLGQAVAPFQGRVYSEDLRDEVLARLSVAMEGWPADFEVLPGVKVGEGGMPVPDPDSWRVVVTTSDPRLQAELDADGAVRFPVVGNGPDGVIETSGEPGPQPPRIMSPFRIGGQSGQLVRGDGLSPGVVPAPGGNPRPGPGAGNAEEFEMRAGSIDSDPQHAKGDPDCGACFKGSGGHCSCGGVVHVAFGDYLDVDSFYCLYECDKCGSQDEPEEG